MIKKIMSNRVKEIKRNNVKMGHYDLQQVNKIAQQ
jgi:hypothetical protein